MNKKIEQNNNPNGKYGFISMAAMIIGIVVASGIFIKNSEIITRTDSAILTTIAWIIGGLIVLCMMMGFLEITSSSRLKNEQGTILNWSRNFLGKKAAVVIGFYITFLYIPLLTIGLAFFAAKFLLEGTGIDFGLKWGFIFITIMGIAFMAFAQILNGLTSKPGKLFQTIGTFVKLIPLFVIILIAFIAVTGLLTTVETNAVFDPNDPINNGIDPENSFGSYIALIFAVLPGILFSFDGFLYADSLSLEAKKKTTYKKALIFSIIFIIILYVVFSLSTMALADVSETGEDNPYDTLTIFKNVFPNHQSIGTVLVLLIMISVLVAVNGLSTVSSRNLADASHQNLIKDKNGVLLRRNHSEAPYNAAFKIFIFMIIFAIVLRMGDAIMITWGTAGGSYALGNDLQLTGIATSLASVFMFFMYGLILTGGIVNRFSKKIVVEKSSGFIFFAIIAMIFMVASAGYFLWDIFLQDIVWIANGSAAAGIHKGVTLRSASKELIAMIFFLTILISMWVGIIIYNYNHVKEANFSNYPNKINARKTYDGLVSYKDYEKAIYSKSNFSTLVENPEKLDYEWYLKQQVQLDKKIGQEKEKLHIRSFLPLKFQEKNQKDKNQKEELEEKTTTKEKHITSKERIEVLFTSWKHDKNGNPLIPAKNEVVKKDKESDEITKKESQTIKIEVKKEHSQTAEVAKIAKQKEVEKKAEAKLEAKKLLQKEKAAQKIKMLKAKDEKFAQKKVLKAEKKEEKAALLVLKKSEAKQRAAMKAKLKAKKAKAKEQALLAKREDLAEKTAIKQKEQAKIEKAKLKAKEKSRKAKELALSLLEAKEAEENLIEQKKLKIEADLAKKAEAEKVAKEQIKQLELEKVQIITTEIDTFKTKEAQVQKIAEEKENQKLTKKEQEIAQKKKEAAIAAFHEKQILQAKEQAKIAKEKEIASLKAAKAKEAASLKKAQEKEAIKAKKIANKKAKELKKTELKKEKQKLISETEKTSQIQEAKNKVKTFQEKTIILAKKDLVKVQTKTKELKKNTNAKFNNLGTILSKKENDQNLKKEKIVLNKVDALKKEELSNNQKLELENLKVKQYQEDVQIAKKENQKAKKSLAFKINKSELKAKEAKEIYKTNKQILKEAKLAEKEALEAETQKYKANLNLGKLRIEKGFSDLKNNLISEGVNFDLKISKNELQQIAQEYTAFSDEQLDLKFSDYGIKINNLKNKGQKYNLLKEFEKTDVLHLKAQLDFYKISYKENATKGELFSLLKN